MAVELSSRAFITSHSSDTCPAWQVPQRAAIEEGTTHGIESSATDPGQQDDNRAKQVT